MILCKKTDECCIEWQWMVPRVTTNDNSLQRMTTRDSDLEWMRAKKESDYSFQNEIKDTSAI